MAKVNDNKTEDWKDIPGYECFYQASSTGLIRSVDRTVSMNQGDRKRFIPGQLMSPKIGSSGYLQVSLSIDGKRSTYDVHRIIGQIHIENPENLPEINHEDTNKLNNNAINLKWIDRAGNVKHAYKNGLVVFKSRRGERNNQSKIKDADVPRIREMKASGNTYKKIAAIFGVSLTCISHIINKRSYTHV